jgi:hypothetical protein
VLPGKPLELQQDLPRSTGRGTVGLTVASRTSTARSRRPPDDLVTWRDGIHIVSTPIWCDALRASEICFVSRAEALASTRHGQLVGTAETFALLDSGQRKRRPDTELAVPVGHPFTLGTRRIELLASGHSVGAASMAVDVDGRRVLYAGEVNPRGGGLGGTADLRECDTVILSARFGHRRFGFEPTDRVAGRALDLAREVTAAGGAAVMLVESVGRALDVAARFAAAELPLSAHRSIQMAARRLTGHVELPALRRYAPRDGAAIAGRALLWPLAGRAALAELPAGSRIAVLSGDAVDPGFASQHGADVGIAWTGGAGRDELVDYIAATGARRVFLTDRHAEELAAELDGGRLSVSPIGPPVQMSLFE